MELVSAAKMRRATAAAVHARAYASYAWELLVRLHGTKVTHPLLTVRPVKKILVIVVSANRGLAGAFTSNVIKKVAATLKQPREISRNRVGDRWVEPESGAVEFEFVVVGKRGESGVKKISKNIIASFVDVADVPKFSDVQPIIKIAITDYAAAKYDKVVIVYTQFVSGLVQQAKIRQLLPVSPVDLEKTLFPMGTQEVPDDHKKWDEGFVLYEPKVEEIVFEAVTRLIETQVYQSFLESAASEHSARMMSMRQATDAATDMIDSLTLAFNQARQASITREISEISAGKAALE